MHLPPLRIFYNTIFILYSIFPPFVLAFDNNSTIMTNLPGSYTNTHPIPCKTSYKAAIIAESSLVSGNRWQKAFFLPLDSFTGSPGPAGFGSGVLCPGRYRVSGQIVVQSGPSSSGTCNFFARDYARTIVALGQTLIFDIASSMSPNSTAVVTINPANNYTYDTVNGILVPPYIWVTSAICLVNIAPSQLNPWINGGVKNGDMYLNNANPISYIQLDATTLYNSH